MQYKILKPLIPNFHSFLLLLLLASCCCMTAGHYSMSSATAAAVAADHHHHQYQHHHYHPQQYQQEQQKQYHLSPSTSSPFIPVAPQRPSHLLPHQHIVIRRANLPHQHHHQQQHRILPTNPHPVVPATRKVIRDTDRLLIEEELKALKKKRKRLRQLREEVRELSNHLQSKRILLKDDIGGGDLLKKHKAKEAHIRWRKQITTRVKAIMKRLKRLENEVKTERDLTKEKKKLTGRLPILPGVIHTTAITPTFRTLPGTTTKNFKIKRLHSSINQSKNGESGGICFGHKDCKPGLCCHRTALVGANSSSISSSSVCHQYSLKEGEPCQDSCQCEARLHCFRSSSHAKTGKSANTKSKRDTQAICKKVSTEDIANGIYLNSKDSSFPTNPSSSSSFGHHR